MIVAEHLSYDAKVQADRSIRLDMSGTTLVPGQIVRVVVNPHPANTPRGDKRARSGGQRVPGLAKDEVRILEGFDDPVPGFEDYS